MGREVRKVPKDWQHPRQDNRRERYQPMYDKDFETAAAAWKAGYKQWEESPHSGEEAKYEFWEWEGGPPDRKYYRPKWTDEERTHYQMYESTSEGTPISPVMESREELARWLADNNASAFAGQTATYEHWLSVCQGGWAPSAAITAEGKLISGVEALGERK